MNTKKQYYIPIINKRNTMSQIQVVIHMSTTTLTDVCKLTYPRTLTKKKKLQEF